MPIVGTLLRIPNLSEFVLDNSNRTSVTFRNYSKVLPPHILRFCSSLRIGDPAATPVHSEKN